MSVVLKKENGKDCIVVNTGKDGEDENLTVTGEFILTIDDDEIEFSATTSVTLSPDNVNLTHDITYIEPDKESIFMLSELDKRTYFNILLTIINFRLPIEIQKL